MVGLISTPAMDEISANCTDPNRNRFDFPAQSDQRPHGKHVRATRRRLITIKHADVRKSAGASTSDAKGQKDQGQKTKD